MSERERIRNHAEQAWRDGRAPNDACPWSFYEWQGLHWVACYWCTDLEFLLHKT